MLFLIEYDRADGQLVALTTFDDSRQRIAEQARLNLELELNRSGVDREVVLLKAATEAAVRETHRRYFETGQQLVDR